MTRTARKPKAGEDPRWLDLTELHESPLNPRKDFSELGELAASIGTHGILQPLVVRRNAHGYEIVCGHRRARAAKLAGLDTVPVRVCDIASDAEVLAAMLIENCQREDIHPMDEAAAYGDLERGGKTVAEIAGQVGKSEAHVYKRLHLLALSDTCRQAFLAGKITLGVAYVLARIPTGELQDQALREVGPTTHTEAMTAREAAAHVLRNFMLKLSDAPFSRTDESLVPEAGACTACPKKTGNQPVLFDDVRSKETCTDPACYQAKAESHWQRVSQRAASRGTRVLSEKEAKKVFRYGSDEAAWQSGYVDPKAPHPYDKEGRTWKEILGKDAPTPVLARSPRGRTVKLIERAKADAALQAKGIAQERPSAPLTTEGDRKKAALKKRQCALAVKSAEEVLRALTGQIREQGLSVEAWKLLIGVFVTAGLSGPPREDDDARTRALTDAHAQGDVNGMHAVVADIALWSTVDAAKYRAERPRELEELAALYGIDYAATEKALRASARKKSKKEKEKESR